MNHFTKKKKTYGPGDLCNWRICLIILLSNMFLSMVHKPIRLVNFLLHFHFCKKFSQMILSTGSNGFQKHKYEASSSNLLRILQQDDFHSREYGWQKRILGGQWWQLIFWGPLYCWVDELVQKCFRSKMKLYSDKSTRLIQSSQASL